jgi:hypothetical protein
MKAMIKSMLLVIGMMISTISFGATCTALTDGDWSDASTWSCGSVPGCGDIIIIPAGIQVDVDIQVDLDENSSPFCSTPIQIMVFGTLEMKNGRKIYLSCGSTMEIMAGGQLTYVGGGGSSNAIYICDDEVWNSDSGSVAGYTMFGTPSPMPTTLVSFDNEMANGYLNSTWVVESERMVDTYLIEVSLDNENWESLTSVKSVGDHSTVQRYSVTSELNTSSFQYVRLVVRDLNGMEQVLETKSLEFHSQSVLFPNPASNSQNVTISGIDNGTVMIVDQQGKDIGTLTVVNQVVPLSDLTLKSGIYFVRIIETSETIRLVVQ